jgi:hypothetical protein
MNGMDEDRRPPGAVAYVVDRRTRQWVPAGRALYTRIPNLDMPMGSHLVAHADERSRHDDDAAPRGLAVAIADVFDARVPPGALP